jgi:Ca2+/Na+ antiporter
VSLQFSHFPHIFQTTTNSFLSQLFVFAFNMFFFIVIYFLTFILFVLFIFIQFYLLYIFYTMDYICMHVINLSFHTLHDEPIKTSNPSSSFLKLENKDSDGEHS